MYVLLLCGHIVDRCWNKHGKPNNIVNNVTSDSPKDSTDVITLTRAEFERLKLSTSIAATLSPMTIVAQT